MLKLLKLLSPFDRQEALSVSVRLCLALAMVMGLSFTFALSSLMQQRDAAERLRGLRDEDFQRIVEVKRWVALSDKSAVSLMAINQSFDPNVITLLEGENKASLKELEGLQASVASWARTPDERAWFDSFLPLWKEVKERLAKTEEMRADGDLPQLATFFGNELMPRLKRLRTEVARFDAIENEHLKGKIDQLDEEGRRRWIAWTVGMTICSSFVCLFLMRLVLYLRRFLKKAIGVTETISSGDLTVRLVAERRDEFGQLGDALSMMATALSGVVHQIAQTSESINVASGEIATGNSDLSQRTEIQVSNIHRTAATMTELSEAVRHTATAAMGAEKLALEASNVATQGRRAVAEVVSTMSAIDVSSRRIEEIISVIDGISFQTNILALNAAIEAARAGEHGRGFSVVAGEVRQLASRSAVAAREIKKLIEASVSDSRSGCEKVANAGGTIDELVSSVQRVSAIVSDISKSAQRQGVGLSEVSKAIEAIDASTQKNASLVGQAASAAESMRMQAAAMTRVVHHFKTAAG